MSGTKTEPKVSDEQKRRNAEHEKAIAAQHAAIEAAHKVVVPEPYIVGYEETQPHQEEVVVGSVEQTQLLSSFPNASSYGPDVNVVIVDPPDGGGDPQLAHAQQNPNQQGNISGTTLHPAEPVHDNKSKK